MGDFKTKEKPRIHVKTNSKRVRMKYKLVLSQFSFCKFCFSVSVENTLNLEKNMDFL